MGLIAIVKSFTRVVRDGVKLSDVKLDPDGGSNITGEHFADPGDDSFPLDTDFAAAMPVRRSGSAVPVGYADPINDPVSGPGEKRIYGRDPATGVVVNQVHLKADGSILASNDNGSIELKADGEALHGSGAKITADGDIVTSEGISLRNHVHAYTWTDPAGSSSTAPPT